MWVNYVWNPIPCCRHHKNLLYITADETLHCILVKDLNQLLLRQYNNHKSKTYFCQYCLHGFTSEEVLKNHLGRCKLHRVQRSKSKRLTTRWGTTKSNSQKQNTNYIYLLLSMWILKVFYVNKTHVSHCHQNPSLPNTSITYHVGAASMWNAVMDNAGAFRRFYMHVWQNAQINTVRHVMACNVCFPFSKIL